MRHRRISALGVDRAQHREPHVGVVALPERGGRDGRGVDGAAAVGQAELLAHGLGHVEGAHALVEGVGLERVAAWAAPGGGHVPRVAVVVGRKAAHVQEALSPAVGHRVLGEELWVGTSYA